MNTNKCCNDIVWDLCRSIKKGKHGKRLLQSDGYPVLELTSTKALA